MMYLLITAGLVFLFFGGNFLLNGCVAIAHHFRLSNLLVSSVIIGFGTSLPELAVSLGAAIKGSPDIALGNVVGSNISNILLILGVAALINPILFIQKEVHRDAYMLVASTLALCLFAYFNYLNFISGLILVGFIVAYIIYSYQKDSKSHEEIQGHEATEDFVFYKKIGEIALGLGLLFVGSQALISGSISLAEYFNLSEAVIGLSIVAIGTSIPELATAIIASYKRQKDVILGNILGSNAFNSLFVMGATSIVHDINVHPKMASFDIWIMLGVTALLFAVLKKGTVIHRLLGGIFLLLYVAYIAFIYLGPGH